MTTAVHNQSDKPLVVSNGAGGHTPVYADSWHPALVADVLDNDSDKTITVPAATEWQPLLLYVSLATTATAGNRQLEVILTDDADNVLGRAQAGVVQAASLTRLYTFALNAPDLLAFRDTDKLSTPLPIGMLPAGYKINVLDNKAVDAAADDMTVRLSVLARSV